VSWTNTEYGLRAKKFGARQFEEYPESMDFSTDLNPLYSSFSKDKVFSPKPVKILRSTMPRKQEEDFGEELVVYDDLHVKDLNLLTRYSSFVQLELPIISEDTRQKASTQASSTNQQT
jgi:hypothetical protein